MVTGIKTIVQSIVIVALASGAGLIYNSVRGNGLDLSRNFFRKGVERPPSTPTPPEPPPPVTPPENEGTAEGGADDGGDVTSGEPQTLDGFEIVTTERLVKQLRELSELIVLVDARSESKYQEGHISGAHYLNHYQSDKLIDGVRPHLDAAIYIVVYCGGGDCDDSLHLATDLHQVYGYEVERIWIYKGGTSEWKQNGLPLLAGPEQGELPTDLSLGATADIPVAAPSPPPGTDATGSAPVAPADEPPSHGLQVVTTAQALEYNTELKDASLFLDARSRDKYEEGHIPGAVYLNHYQSDKLIGDVKPLIDEALFVIVYCGGGDCEDSIHLASDLIEDHGVEFEKVFLFEGGMKEWLASGHPVVKGPERD